MNHQTQIAETACGPVEYSAAGDGDPVLYFHGTGGTCDGMMPFEYKLSKRRFSIDNAKSAGIRKYALGFKHKHQ